MSFLQRVDQGFYADIYHQLCNAEGAFTPAVNKLKIGKSIISSVVETKKGHQLVHHLPEDPPTQPLAMTFIGEILEKKDGTNIGANGNQPDPGVGVDDQSNVRDGYGLGFPTMGIPDLNTAWENQISFLNETIEDARDRVYDGLEPYEVEEISSVLGKKRNSVSYDIVKFTSNMKYRRANAGDVVATPVRQSKDLSPSDSSMADTTGSSNSDDLVFKQEIKLGTLYDPKLQPDCKGSYYNFRRAKSVQLPYYDLSGAFIKPWENRDKLRPGTLVQVDAILIAYLIPATDRDGRPLLRKIFQLQIDKLQVIAPSPLPMEPFHVATVGYSSGLSPSRKRPSSSLFTPFIPISSSPPTPVLPFANEDIVDANPTISTQATSSRAPVLKKVKLTVTGNQKPAKDGQRSGKPSKVDKGKEKSTESMEVVTVEQDLEEED